jgi:hypothetical protein
MPSNSPSSATLTTHLSTAITQFTLHPDDSSALALLTHLDSDSSPSSHFLSTFPSLISLLQTALPQTHSISEIRLLLFLLDHFPTLQTESLSYFLFQFFSNLPFDSDPHFLQFLLQCLTLTINETTIHHITATFTQSLKTALSLTSELNLCASEIFARAALFIPLTVKNRHFAILAREAISSSNSRNAPKIALGLVNLITKNPRVIEDPWIVDNLIRILYHDEPMSTCILLDFLQAFEDERILILCDDKLASIVRLIAVRENGEVTAYCSAFRAIRRLLKVFPKRCGEIYCVRRPWGVPWSVLGLIEGMQFAAKVEAGLLIAEILKEDEVRQVYVEALDPTTVCRERANVVETGILGILSLDHRELLVEILDGMRCVFEGVMERELLWREFGEIGIVEAIEGLVDHEDDEIASKVAALKKLAGSESE